MQAPIGFVPQRVISAKVGLSFTAFPEFEDKWRIYQAVIDRVRAIPSVRAASVQTDLPLKGDGERRAFTPDQATGGTDPTTRSPVAVTWTFGDYFRTFGVPIVKGRAFLPEEDVENRQTAIVSRALAERYWPGQDPIGKRVKWGIPTSRLPWT